MAQLGMVLVALFLCGRDHKVCLTNSCLEKCFRFAKPIKGGHMEEMMNLCFDKMSPCPLKLGHILGNSGIGKP